MSEKILVPVLGESITEATVAKWLKSKGETVEIDEPIVELETDKVNLEVPSPVGGVLSAINAKNGQAVEVGAILGIVTEGKNQISEKSTFNPKQKIEKTLDVNENGPELFNANVVKLEKSSIVNQNGEQPLVLNKEVKTESQNINNVSIQTLSPAVRKIVEENKIDTKNIQGTGKDGRIVKGDLIQLMGITPHPSERKAQYGHEERIKMTRLRMTIAKRLKQAQETAAMLTTFNEVDMGNIIQMRKDHQGDFQNRFGIKLGFMSFFVKACIVGLKSFPAINAEIDNEDIIYKNYYNISFAVGTDKGLVVPVLRDVGSKTLLEISAAVKDLSQKARTGDLGPDELVGGTFTISILGSVDGFTPILNQSQVALLGVGRSVQKPVVKDREIVIREMMTLSLTGDHQVIDGAVAANFFRRLQQIIENPSRLVSK